MQSFQKRFSVVTGFVLLLAVLMANAFITRRQLQIQIGNQEWTDHSRVVLYELAQTESLLKDAETGQRGFLYTNNPKYLEPYNLAAGQGGSHLDNLARLTADNPNQQARVVELRDLSHQKLEELAQTISLYRAAKAEEAKA